jgi:hypothetical protein
MLYGGVGEYRYSPLAHRDIRRYGMLRIPCPYLSGWVLVGRKFGSEEDLVIEYLDEGIQSAMFRDKNSQSELSFGS